MKLFSRIAAGLGAFILVTGVVYGLASSEFEGLTLMITLAGGALLIGAYLIAVQRRARAIVGGRRTEAMTVAGGEPHVVPTIWPLVFALSMIGLVVGALAARWALIPGGLLFVAASAGWVLDVRRQWIHHAQAAHDEVEQHTTPEVGKDRPRGPQTE